MDKDRAGRITSEGVKLLLNFRGPGKGRREIVGVLTFRWFWNTQSIPSG